MSLTQEPTFKRRIPTFALPRDILQFLTLLNTFLAVVSDALRKIDIGNLSMISHENLSIDGLLLSLRTSPAKRANFRT